MSRETVNALCASFAAATHDDALGPGHDSWKIGGKLFASMGPDSTSVSVKTDSIDTAQMLIDAGAAIRARYFHRSWVAVPVTADPAELVHRLNVSYDIVRAGLTRAVRDSLPDH